MCVLFGIFVVVAIALCIPSESAERTSKTATFLVHETARRTETAQATTNALLRFKYATEAAALAEALPHITSEENLKREHAATAAELSYAARAEQTAAMAHLERAYPAAIPYGNAKIAAGWQEVTAPAAAP